MSLRDQKYRQAGNKAYRKAVRQGQQTNLHETQYKCFKCGGQMQSKFQHYNRCP